MTLMLFLLLVLIVFLQSFYIIYLNTCYLISNMLQELILTLAVLWNFNQDDEEDHMKIRRKYILESFLWLTHKLNVLPSMHSLQLPL